MTCLWAGEPMLWSDRCKMDFGKVEYMVNGIGLRLTLIGEDDVDILKDEGLASLRRRRLVRLTNEAVSHGVLLSYDDLCCLLVSSLSTLKRDVSIIEGAGLSVLIKGRRRRNSIPGLSVVGGA